MSDSWWSDECEFTDLGVSGIHPLKDALVLRNVGAV